MSDLQKVCVVTGGSAGIGLAIVQRFVRDGYRVFNLDLNNDADCGEHIACDVASSNQVEEAIQQVLATVGKIDVVVSNAGIHLSANLENTSAEELERVLAVNVKGAFYLLKETLPILRQQKQGAVILIASDQSVIGKQNSFAYNMSKAALASMARTTALDYAQFGIRANAVCPGTIETPLYHTAIDSYCKRTGRSKEQVHAEEAAMQPLGRIGQPKEVAAQVAFLASDEAAFITGGLQLVDGGYTAQ